jgi:UDP-N-acetylglucosamine diphosphorylase/glucosamine-1-phosphate N-acetyltransferase
LNNVCAVADLRTGIFTARERWEHILKDHVFINTADYLSVLYEPAPQGLHTWIDANLIPDEYLIGRIFSLEENEAIADSKGLIAAKKKFDNGFNASETLNAFAKVHKTNDAKRIEYPWNIFQYNNEILLEDFARITAGRNSQQLPKTNQYIGPENIFIEEGAVINFSIINAATGPVYIGKNCTVMEGCTIRGPVALCERTILKMGSKIYGATTLGPCCVGGGEIKNTVIQGYSNKAHEGYLGDAVIGKWCNLGAGTSNSNLKNTASAVKMWDGFSKNYVEVDVKCGVVMGDYSRTAINSSLNTGSVIGVCCNVFGDGLLPKFISDFQWGTKGLTKYEFQKSLQDIANWKKMKDSNLSDAESKVLKYIFERESL